mmetsp:Transcript_100784/g.260427  ORF Transcript_100784/g.260427 Transcript_100784/m.260427 type:complete len:602 (+) Transcript_100784:119-1924(+)
MSLRLRSLALLLGWLLTPLSAAAVPAAVSVEASGACRGAVEPLLPLQTEAEVEAAEAAEVDVLQVTLLQTRASGLDDDLAPTPLAAGAPRRQFVAEPPAVEAPPAWTQEVLGSTHLSAWDPDASGEAAAKMRGEPDELHVALDRISFLHQMEVVQAEIQGATANAAADLEAAAREIPGEDAQGGAVAEAAEATAAATRDLPGTQRGGVAIAGGTANAANVGVSAQAKVGEVPLITPEDLGPDKSTPEAHDLVHATASLAFEGARLQDREFEALARQGAVLSALAADQGKIASKLEEQAAKIARLGKAADAANAAIETASGVVLGVQDSGFGDHLWTVMGPTGEVLRGIWSGVGHLGHLFSGAGDALSKPFEGLSFGGSSFRAIRLVLLWTVLGTFTGFLCSRPLYGAVGAGVGLLVGIVLILCHSYATPSFGFYLFSIALQGWIYRKFLAYRYPPMRNEAERSQEHFTYGLFSACLGDPDVRICLTALFCSPARWADTVSAEKLDVCPGLQGRGMAVDRFCFMMFSFALLAYFSIDSHGISVLVLLMWCVYVRQRMRESYQLPHGTPMVLAQDCCAYAFCSPCAIMQDAMQAEFVATPELP